VAAVGKSRPLASCCICVNVSLFEPKGKASLLSVKVPYSPLAVLAAIQFTLKPAYPSLLNKLVDRVQYLTACFVIFLLLIFLPAPVAS